MHNPKKNVYKTEAPNTSEYRPKSSVSMAIVKEGENFDRNKWREDKINTILSSPADCFVKVYDHLMISEDKRQFEWNKDIVSQLDDVQLIFCCNIINNTPTNVISYFKNN